MIPENENLPRGDFDALAALTEITLSAYNAQSELWTGQTLAQRLGDDLVPPLVLTSEEYAQILSNLDLPEAERPTDSVSTDGALELLAGRYAQCARAALLTACQLYRVAGSHQKFLKMERAWKALK